MSNIVEAFAEYLESSSVATLGTDLFIGEAPTDPDALWWLTGNGGNPETKAATGERIKTYQVGVFYRDRSGKNVYDRLFALEDQLNSGSIDLTGFDTVEVQAITFPIDQDLDDEDRKVGLLQAQLTIYKGA